MLKAFLTFLMIFSAMGFLVSVVIHVCSFFVDNASFPKEVGWLHIVAVFTGIPVVFVSNWLSREYKRKDYWVAVFRGCPVWMKRAATMLFCYAFIGNFVLFLAKFFSVQGGKTQVDYRLFSGVWMFIYFVSMATMYSALHLEPHFGASRSVDPGKEIHDKDV